ncbi:hypothetical protein HMI54_004339 [Coelomomyces lativittatus]|nr:hypothetical protein HMI56_003756 [Coelomomyces lativittatus]KAJ1506276.1 hypothetical protein HMI55_001245 [Coelomomyces lativittatus]KAJ1507256.1 hypothetical protein HMI54_004339 [Coelomomyces lativittatus]
MRNSKLLYTLLVVAGLLYLGFLFFYSSEPPNDFTDLIPLEGNVEPLSPWTTFKGKSFPSIIEKGGGVMSPMQNETLRKELGHASWHLIHTMGNSYPLKPKEDEQEAMRLFLYLLGRLYPCGECASHFRAMLSEHPPGPHLKDRPSLAIYLCKLHNKVNLRLHHPIFDCSQVFDRWKCGCADHVESNSKLPSPDDSLSPQEKQEFIERNSLFEADYSALQEQRKKA